MSDIHVPALRRIVGAANCLTDDADTKAYTTDYRKLYTGASIAVVRPADTREVSQVLAYCHAHGIAVVPQGGNTSLQGGAVPSRASDGLPGIVLSLSRMNRVVSVDPLDDTMVVEAGVTLAAARDAAASERRTFPLRIGSEGSCQIGGNVSTNAGGTAVLRYGNMRELVLGLEVVLPDGEIWDGLRALRKDNTGYDLKQLFIGSEGTLGIVTTVVLKLFPMPRSTSVALVGTSSPATALRLLTLLKSRLGSDVTAFELISAPAMTLAREYLADPEPLFGEPQAWMVLIEAISNAGQSAADELFQSALEAAFESSLITDALVATNETQARRFWRLREEISDAQTRAGGSVRCDISVPLSAVPAFIGEASAGVLELDPSIRMVIYGHMGDGNVHFNPLRPAAVPAADFIGAFTDPITRLVDGIAMAHRGSISAEHGIGVAKREALLSVKSKAELRTSWRIKRALDPKNLLNPGKVLPPMANIQETMR